MNQDIPKWVSIPVAVVIGILAILVLTRMDTLHVYGTYLRQKSPEISTNLDALSPKMDEAALRKLFEGVPLTCIHQGPGRSELGDRVCYTAIDRADGDAALTFAAFFKKGKLAHTIVQTPWWVHRASMQRLEARYGKGKTAGLVGGRYGGAVLRWQTPNGYVEVNQVRSFHPLDWNLVMWTGS